MTGQISGIDHLVVGVNDLDVAAATYDRLGFTVTPRGFHRNMATANNCIMFADDYLELMGIVAPDLPDRGFGARLATLGEGLDRVAFATDDPAALSAFLRQAGHDVREPVELRRPVDLPDGGSADAVFRLVMLPGTVAPPANAFVCFHETPALVRRPQWLRHANGAMAIRSLALVVERPADLAAAWRAMPGVDVDADGGGALLARTRGASVHLLSPDGLGERFPGIGGGVVPPAMVAMGLAVADPGRTAAFLARAGVTHARDARGAVHVPPTESHGVHIVFEQ